MEKEKGQSRIDPTHDKSEGKDSGKNLFEQVREVKNDMPGQNYIGITQKIASELDEAKTEVQESGKGYLKYILDLSLPTNETKYMLSIGGIDTIPSGELIGVKGRAKMGKSQFGYYLISVLLAGQSRGSVRPLQARYKVLLFDTEQSKESLKKCCQRALRYAGLPDDKNDVRFMPFFLRPFSVEERRAVISDAIEGERPDIVFIDGVRDLLHDFNSLEQSGDVIQWLMTLISDFGCTIVCVLHQNKTKDDANMRGHLGTELLNKLSDCFEVSKKDGAFMVTCTDSRNVVCGDVAFSINAKGDFTEAETVKDIKDAEDLENKRRILKLCYDKKECYGRNELGRAYALESTLSEKTAYRHIKQAKDMNLLYVGSNGKYYLSTQ